MTGADLPNLQQFLGGYFNQDWKCDHASWQDVVEAFRREASPGAAAAVPAELDHLLKAKLDDAQLADFLLRELHCYLRPEAFGLTKRQWLEEVRAELAR